LEVFPAIKKKKTGLYNGSDSFAERLIALLLLKGSSSQELLFIYWLKRGLMPGLTFSNELISRDEGYTVTLQCICIIIT
jgi:ribonucleotide reductase beta subunit family protein with ferritin-like domain